jgi:protein O-GlcNAc transferase
MVDFIGTTYRTKIEAESEHFLDVSTWSVPKIIDRIVHDGIHVLINLNGYTKGARNEIFAARPCPLQIAYMGFAGTMGAEWIDYFVVDEVVAPRCIADLEDGLYTEKFIYMPHSYFVNDHRQGFRDGVLERIENGVLKPLSDIEYQVYRRHWRRSLFPDLADDVIIFANFNQLYKVIAYMFLHFNSVNIADRSSDF